MGITFVHDENDDNMERLAARLRNERPRVKVFGVCSEPFSDRVKSLEGSLENGYFVVLTIEPLTVPITDIEII